VGEIVEHTVGHALGQMIVIGYVRILSMPCLENVRAKDGVFLANVYAIFTCVEFLQ
jgi:hypothetical protein